MSPRRRKPENAHLPKYMYRHPKRPGYRVMNPITGKYTYYPDAKYTEATVRLVAAQMAKLAESGEPDQLGVLIPKYLEYLKDTNNRPSTLKVKASILNWYANRWGQFRASQVSRGVLQGHWQDIGYHGWAKHRQIWRAFLNWCRASGYVDTNEADLTLPPPNTNREKLRHTAEGIEQIRANADEWLRIAIDLAIYSLQDRSTLLSAKLDDVRKTPSGYEWDLTRSKVGRSMTVRVAKGTKLHDALRAALAHSVTGKYLIRRKPTRRKRGEREEWSQVLPNFLTQSFAKAREGVYDLPSKQQPGFHSLRAWGAHLYSEAGVPDEQTQALMAHASVKMTERYQDGHGKVKREVVEAVL